MSDEAKDLQPSRTVEALLKLNNEERKMRQDDRSGSRGGFSKGGSRDGGFRGGNGGGRSGGGFNRGGFNQGPREMHKAICAECKNECEVPFKPSGDKPVYCRECFQKHKPQRF